MTQTYNSARKSIEDIWNTFMVDGANFSLSDYDIPFCPTTAKQEDRPSKSSDKRQFEEDSEEMSKHQNPHAIIVYGSANYPCFQKLKEQGRKIHEFPSRTCSYYQNRRKAK